VVHDTADPEVIVGEFDYHGQVATTGRAFRVANVQVLRIRGRRPPVRTLLAAQASLENLPIETGAVPTDDRGGGSPRRERFERQPPDP